MKILDRVTNNNPDMDLNYSERSKHFRQFYSHEYATIHGTGGNL